MPKREGSNSVAEPRKINCHYQTGRGLLQLSGAAAEGGKGQEEGPCPKSAVPRRRCGGGLGPNLQTEDTQGAGRRSGRRLGRNRPLVLQLGRSIWHRNRSIKAVIIVSGSRFMVRIFCCLAALIIWCLD